MTRNIICIALIVIAFFAGYLSKETYEKPNVSEEYGKIRIPVPIYCDFSMDEFSGPNIRHVELVPYDLNIKSVYSHQYLLISHEGYPDKVLAMVNVGLKKCLPDTVTEYDNASMLGMDLVGYFEQSNKTAISVSLKDGKATITYNSTQN